MWKYIFKNNYLSFIPLFECSNCTPNVCINTLLYTVVGCSVYEVGKEENARTTMNILKNQEHSFLFDYGNECPIVSKDNELTETEQKYIFE